MPTLAEAQHFAADPRTTVAQLQRACTLLGLEPTADATTLRALLIKHFETLAADQPVVCLNPRLTEPVGG